MNGPNFESRKNLLNIPSQAFFRKGSLNSDISLLDDVRNSFLTQGITDDKELDKNPQKTIQKSVKSCLSRFSKNFNLDLLKDGVYLNILYGISICFVTDMNLKLIVPFVLLENGFTRPQVALALSIAGVSDICARLFVPPIVDKISFSWRATFILGLICTGLSYLSFALQTVFGPIMTTLAIIGFFHGMTLTSFPLVLAEYSLTKSKDNFPSVLGLSMVFKGIFMGVFGPLSGYLRDAFNSYTLFIYFQVVLLASVFITWVVEIIISKYKYNKQATTNIILKESDDKITGKNVCNA